MKKTEFLQKMEIVPTEIKNRILELIKKNYSPIDYFEMENAMYCLNNCFVFKHTLEGTEYWIRLGYEFNLFSEVFKQRSTHS